MVRACENAVTNSHISEIDEWLTLGPLIHRVRVQLLVEQRHFNSPI